MIVSETRNNNSFRRNVWHADCHHHWLMNIVHITSACAACQDLLQYPDIAQSGYLRRRHAINKVLGSFTKSSTMPKCNSADFSFVWLLIKKFLEWSLNVTKSYILHLFDVSDGGNLVWILARYFIVNKITFERTQRYGHEKFNSWKLVSGSRLILRMRVYAVQYFRSADSKIFTGPCYREDMFRIERNYP